MNEVNREFWEEAEKQWNLATPGMCGMTIKKVWVNGKGYLYPSGCLVPQHIVQALSRGKIRDEIYNK